MLLLLLIVTCHTHLPLAIKNDSFPRYRRLYAIRTSRSMDMSLSHTHIHCTPCSQIKMLSLEKGARAGCQWADIDMHLDLVIVLYARTLSHMWIPAESLLPLENATFPIAFINLPPTYTLSLIHAFHTDLSPRSCDNTITPIKAIKISARLPR